MEQKIRKIRQKPIMPKLLRVAAYARVSSEKEEQLHSLGSQVDVYTRMIQRNPAWIFVGIYADEGITGTKAERPQFVKLMEDCRAGLIDMVITKSISRFARNTVTLLAAIRELRSLGVDVYFEENNIHCLRAEGEVLLTILAAYAQAESFSVSENQKWRIRSAYERGEVMNWRFLYGYDITKEGVKVNKEEAEIVREIYRRVADGESFESVCKDLNRRGIPRKLGGKWSSGHMREILSNEKYIGNVILQKTFVSDHIEKRLVKNTGQLDKVLVEEHHPAIVDRETYERVQEILQRLEKASEKRKRPGKSELTGLISCPNCGKHYRHITSNGSTGWICSTYFKKGRAACQSKKIPDTALRQAIATGLGLAEYDPKAIRNEILTIFPYEGNRLQILLQNGKAIEASWSDRSRAESWTPEMRMAAKQRAERRGTWQR